MYLKPTAAIPAAATSPASDLQSERTKCNAVDRLAGASHATTAVLVPGSTTVRMKVNVDASIKRCPPSGPTSRSFNRPFCQD